MPRIILRETITKEIDIPMEALYELIDNLSEKERESVLNRLKEETVKLKAFKKGKIESIMADFDATNLYEDDFLKDLQDGLKKASVYNK